jgi:cytochrome c oxidase assembly factor CtaG/putative copper export protein
VVGTIRSIHIPQGVALLLLAIDFLPVITGLIVTGYLFAQVFLLPERRGEVMRLGITSITKVAMAWLTFSAVQLFATLQEILGGGFDLTTLRSFITQTGLGRTLAIQVGAALLVLLFIGRVRRSGGALILLPLALVGVIAPFFESHSGDAGMHGLAIGSIIFHIAGIGLWLGGLVALLLIDPSTRAKVLPRFSTVALWLSIVVITTGAANSWTRMNFADAWNSTYSLLLIVKIVLVIALLLFAAYLRRSFASRGLSNRIIGMEVFLLAGISFLGSWLSRTEPPFRGDEISPEDLRALAITGIKFPEEPTLWRLLIGYEADGIILGALILAVALYVAGVVRLSRNGVKWPVGRTVAFALGISVIDFATSGGLGLYSYFSFSHHMMAHMLLGMVAPIGIVLSAPITLALRALPAGRDSEERGLRGLLIAIMSSRFVAIWSNPLVALAIFDGSLFALYFTPLFDLLMGSHLGHVVMSLHFLLAGILFFHVIIGVDPRPKEYPYIFRIVILFAAMSIHAFFSVALLSSTSIIGAEYYQNLATPWVTDLLADQRIGASYGWAMGEIPILLSLVATFIQWMRSDDREAARIERRSKLAAARGEKDELEKYNEYLARLAKRDEKLD